MKIVPIKPNDVRDADARADFANYVQSVAFNITLSKHMVDGLGLIRDLGNLRNYDNNSPAGRSYIGSNSVTFARALQKRGLIVHHSLPSEAFQNWKTTDERWRAHRSYSLTRAGELVCELLAEAGLLAPSVPEKKSARAK